MHIDLRQPTPPAEPLAVGVKEAARRLSLSERTLFTLRKNGSGPRCKQIGGRVLYPVAELRRWLDDADDRHGGGK